MGKVLRTAARGAVAGAVGTWLMDLVTTGMQQGQSQAVTEREEAARPNGKGSVDNLVDRVEVMAGRSFHRRQRALLAQGIHYGLGVVPGAL